MNYTAQPVEYSTPKYRFQAIHDGDRYLRVGHYEEALHSYDLVITSDELDWWTEDLKDWLSGSYGFGPCANNACVFHPTEDPNERAVLSAYASFKKMVVYLLMNDATSAENVYQNLLVSHQSETLDYKIIGMATTFWKEYQSSQDIAKACNQAVAHIRIQSNVLAYLTGSSNGQSISYEYDPWEVCPFK